VPKLQKLNAEKHLYRSAKTVTDRPVLAMTANWQCQKEKCQVTLQPSEGIERGLAQIKRIFTDKKDKSKK